MFIYLHNLADVLSPLELTNANRKFSFRHSLFWARALQTKPRFSNLHVCAEATPQRDLTCENGLFSFGQSSLGEGCHTDQTSFFGFA